MTRCSRSVRCTPDTGNLDWRPDRTRRDCGAGNFRRPVGPRGGRRPAARWRSLRRDPAAFSPRHLRRRWVAPCHALGARCSRPPTQTFRLAARDCAAHASRDGHQRLVRPGRITRLQHTISVAPSRLPADDPRRLEFGRLHALSTGLQLVPLLGGLALSTGSSKNDGHRSR